MFPRNFVFLFVLLVSLAGPVHAQTTLDLINVPLKVDEGFPLHVVLTEKLRFKVDEPVYARLVEPVYAFDREVVPSGSEVVGRITGFEKIGKWKRVFTI